MKIKFKVVHLWIGTSIIICFINIYAGIVCSIATIVILLQDKEIEKLKQERE